MKIAAININGAFQERKARILEKAVKQSADVVFVIDHKAKDQNTITYDLEYETMIAEKHILMIVRRGMKPFVEVVASDPWMYTLKPWV